MADLADLIASLEWLRREIIGRNISFETPFGARPLVYADFTASGRGLFLIENQVQRILQFYANTHTEDDFTGKTMTALLHEAERIIKAAVNAGPKGKIVFTGSGTTGGITKLQQILGVYWPPATRERVNTFLQSCLERNPDREACNLALHNYIHANKPIVFVGPYEHHSNEIMWRHTLCEVIEVPLTAAEELDLGKLEELVSDPKYARRPRIGSFSAASNVTGLKTDVHEVARILHRHGALACFDFAACAPYITIDMNRDAESYFDAIYFSPHKFVGGPGTCGILVFNEDIYPKDLPPTVAAGGTVDYVTAVKESFVRDIETREKAGTPGIMQAIRTAMVFQVKQRAGQETIDRIEEYYLNRFMAAFAGDERILFYGITDPAKKLPIVPFNIVHRDKLLHPKFVTRLLNDLFGIQSRAGCSCAGPYGHHLMKIDRRNWDFYRCLITNAGYGGIKPGWVRLNLHYTLNEDEVDYLIAGVKFVLEHGHKFLPLYVFNIKSGEWLHIQDSSPPPVSLDESALFAAERFASQEPVNVADQYAQALTEAARLAENLPSDFPVLQFEPELESLMYYYVHQVVNYHPVSPVRL